MTTVEDQLVIDTADSLREKPYIQSAEATANRQGPYVRVTVSGPRARSNVYAIVDDYPVYIEVVETNQ